MDTMRQPFIFRALTEYNKSVIETMQATMRKMHVEVTGEGLQSLSYKVFTAGGGAYSELSFREYLRFVDMGVGRGHPLGSLAAVGEELRASRKRGLKFIKDKTFKPKKIYSKIAYGKLSYLQGKLLYGYTEEVIASMKAELESKAT